MSPIALVQDLFAASVLPELSAFLLGLLVALSPCPLTTNLAALAYVGQQATAPRAALYSGLLYTLGRMVSYSLLAVLLVLLGFDVSQVSGPLQDIGGYLLGPVLVLAGLIVMGVLPLPLPRLGDRARLDRTLAGGGPAGAFGLGALFALAFCPYSAALFFGALLPLILGSAGHLGLAPAFALGSGLPVLVAALALSAGVAGLTRWLEATAKVELLLRRLAGLALAGAGLYLAALAAVSWLGR